MSLSEILFSTEGRVGRGVYWAMFAVILAISLVAAAIDYATAGDQGFAAQLIAFLIIVYPNLAIQIKRWHDRNKSGWWILIGFIPLVGPIWSLVELGFLRGTAGPNDYGPNPSGTPSPEIF